MDEPREILERKMMSDLTEKELLNELKVINLEDCSPLSWDKYFSQELYVNTNNGRFHILYAGESGPVIFLIHGAGSSAQTWCLFARELLKQVQVRVVAMDLRGHGLSTTDSDHDFNKNVLVNDIIDVINGMMVMLHINENIVLVGHSLGGALATWVATLSLNHHLSGLVVIDVDEQAALDQKSMFEHLISRPTSFSSIEKAIKYSYLNRKLSNLEADRLSIPGQLKKVSNKQEFVWKVDLFETKQFWKDWFLGFSKAFVSLKIPRLIAVSSIDRLDRTLLIGQMQGIFRVEPIERCGHTIHEDDPIYSAKSVSNFLKHHMIVS